MGTEERSPSARQLVLSWLLGERYLLLSVLVCAIAFSVWFNWSHPPMFSSTVVVYLDEPFVASDDAPDLRVVPSDGMRRLAHEAVSHGLLKQLVDVHGLGAHYGFVDDGPYQEAEVVAVLRGHVDVVHEEGSSLMITVNDRDLHMAVRLAAGVHHLLATGLETRASDHLRRVAGVYDKLGRDMATDVNTERSSLERLLAIPNDGVAKDRAMLDMVDVGTRLNVANAELAQLRYAQRSASILASKEHLPKLLLVQKAAPDPRPDPFWTAVIRMITIVVGMLFLAIVLRLAWHRNKEDLRASVRDWMEGSTVAEPVSDHLHTTSEHHPHKEMTKPKGVFLS